MCMHNPCHLCQEHALPPQGKVGQANLSCRWRGLSVQLHMQQQQSPLGVGMIIAWCCSHFFPTSRPCR